MCEFCKHEAYADEIKKMLKCKDYEKSASFLKSVLNFITRKRHISQKQALAVKQIYSKVEDDVLRI